MQPLLMDYGSALRRAVFAIAVCLTASLAGMRAEAQPNLDEVARQFEAVAFGHEHGPSAGIVQKWNGDLRLALFATPGWDVHPYLKAIGGHIQAIEALTGIRVRAADSVAGATLRFGFYPRADFAKMPGRRDDPQFRRWVETSACIALAVGGREGRDRGDIKSGAIAIGTDIPEAQRRHCILEELVQVLGLANDACHYRPSLFCEDDHVVAMTDADEMLLRALYDRRIRSGMPREEALPIIRTVLSEMMAKQQEGLPANSTVSVAAARPY